VIERSQGRGALVSGASAGLTLTDAIVRSTALSSTMSLGRGVEVSGGQLTVRRALVDSNQDAGIYAGAGATVDLADLIARGTMRLGKGQGGGVELYDGTRATLSRVNADRNGSGGVDVAGWAVTATITDLVVRGILSQGFGALGVRAGARASVTRAAFAHNPVLSVFCADPGSWLALSDASILDALDSPESTDEGFGMLVVNHPHALLSRVRVERSRGYGINVSSSATASISDLVVRDTRSAHPVSDDGTGLFFNLEGTAKLERVLIESSRRFGIRGSGPNISIEASDLTVRQTLGSTTGTHHCDGDVDDSMGEGISLETGANLVATRVVIDGSHGANLFLCPNTGGSAPTASISDAVFSSAAALPCTGRPDCPDPTHAYGIEIYGAANLALQRFVVAKNVRAGIAPLPGGANVTLTDGVISDQPLGLSYAGESRPIDQLTDRVAFERNQQNVLLPPPPSISPP
jgi:hypothetical protein